MKQQKTSKRSKAIDAPTEKFLDTISHWIYICLRNNKNGLQKWGFSSKGEKLSCLCAMPQKKNAQRLQTIFRTLMKTATVFINAKKNCLQDIFCACDYVAVFLLWGSQPYQIFKKIFQEHVYKYIYFIFLIVFFVHILSSAFFISMYCYSIVSPFMLEEYNYFSRIRDILLIFLWNFSTFLFCCSSCNIILCQ